ncbi:hypothetical protein HDU79_003199 [Rhizoclosmatium sp. JEL0117]|nr:hypothetical protein HDU79_003199 [Rhizoclosmatium sp. JEL0117]
MKIVCQNKKVFTEYYRMSVNATVLSASAAIWGYPLVQVGLTAAGALTTAGGTLNQWISQDQLSTPTNQAIVTPNYDTLYSQAFLDLTTTGVVVTAPTTVVDRYILFEFMDAYTNVFASTSRRNYPKTNGGGKFLVYGPNSPKVVDESGFDAVLQAPTNLVWLLSRTEVK